jgi:serpin B
MRHLLLAGLAAPAALAFCLATACHSSSGTPLHADTSASPPAPLTSPPGAPMTDAAASDAASSSDPALATTDSAAALKALADANNALGLDVYAAARRGHVNAAISPLSISMALTMTWAGARGDTAAQMKTVLHTDLTPDAALDAETKVRSWMNDPAQTVTLRVANRLFGQKGFAFDQGYLDKTNAAFGAPLEPLDFTGAAGAARTHINDWVARQTDQHIKDLLPAGAVRADTRLVLANAVYFLGKWDQPFKKGETKPAPFHVAARSSKEVPTMHGTLGAPYAHTDGVKVLQLPYTGGQLAMVFVLPDAVDGLEAVESRLSPATLGGWTSALATTRAKVALPSFKIEPSDALALGKTLASLGMPLAFDEAKADFTGIANPPNPQDRLVISNVFHKAFVKVDEEGTEAAAATATVLRTRALIRHEPPPEEFVADHPFLFFLRDVASGTILFMGRVGNPAL